MVVVGIGGAGCAGLPSFSRSPNVSSSYLKLCIRPIQGDALLFCLSLVAIHNGAGECGSLGVGGSQRKEERARRHNTAEKDGTDRSAVMMAWALMDFSSIFASSFPFSCLFSFLLIQ